MSIRELDTFVRNHTTTVARDADAEGIIDVGFFGVVPQIEDGETESLKEKFMRLVAESHAGAFSTLNPFDGKDHGYIEVGGWIGDQEMAMRFMALAEHFGEVTVLTPKKVLGDKIDAAMEDQLMGQGLIAISPKKEPELG